SSRGIGLEIVRQLLLDNRNIVFATCRTPSSAKDLNLLNSSAKGQLHLVQLDINDESSIDSAVLECKRILGDGGLDYLLNNAGIMPVKNDFAFRTTKSHLFDTFQSNVIGTALVSQAFLPLLEQGNRKVIMNMSSGLGSLGSGFGPIDTSYSISKAALNMLTYKQASERPDMVILAMDPGWVQTDMGGPNAIIKPEDSVVPMLNLIKNATTGHSGRFFDSQGKSLPW
ncbi:NAD-P-binding protein, partial [Rickenella mellea]